MYGITFQWTFFPSVQSVFNDGGIDNHDDAGCFFDRVGFNLVGLAGVLIILIYFTMYVQNILNNSSYLSNSDH